tara:strand:- start:266 stop:457 length:192 start_codon:yes stop_codon:yes gene_type:complete
MDIKKALERVLELAEYTMLSFKLDKKSNIRFTEEEYETYKKAMWMVTKYQKEGFGTNETETEE